MSSGRSTVATVNLNWNRHWLPSMVVATLLACVFTACAAADDEPSAEDSSTTSAPPQESDTASPETADSATPTATPTPEAADVSWQDVCSFAPAQVDKAFAFANLKVSSGVEDNSMGPVGCEYRDPAQEFVAAPYSLVVSYKPYGENIGITSVGVFSGNDRAGAFSDACSQSGSSARCEQSSMADYVVGGNTTAWVFTDAFVVELFANGGTIDDPQLIDGLEALARDLATRT